MAFGVAAVEHMAGHQEWIKQGLDDEVFPLVGSAQPGLGGAVLARNTSLAQLPQRVAADPFVAEKVVDAEIIEIAPGLADKLLDFLVPRAVRAQLAHHPGRRPLVGKISSFHDGIAHGSRRPSKASREPVR